MNREKTFYNLYRAIHLDNIDEYDSAIKGITKKLNEIYYPELIKIIDDEHEHCEVVGSVGRGTAIKKKSDIDVLFVLPQAVYRRFNDYDDNGQSALLQDVKNHLKDRYPKTDIKGDGQVVVVEFENFSIDLVPVFQEYNGSFKYADSNNGGVWKNTNPMPEQQVAQEINKTTNNNFVQLSNLIRLWRNNIGFVFSGLLIDTLVYNFFKSYSQYCYYSFINYNELIFKFLQFLSKQSKDNKLYALGSHQEIIDKGKGAYIQAAKNFLEKLQKANDFEDVLEEVYCDMFGKDFQNSLVGEARSLKLNPMEYSYTNTEEFIDNMCPIKIMYNLAINCKVTANGFRPHFLRDVGWLNLNKKLDFFIQQCDVPQPYDIYWKVKNNGVEAYERNMIRGQIFKAKETITERSDFKGNHYVECYIVKNNKCVARNLLNVNIV